MKLSDCNFRDLYKKCVILKSSWIYDGIRKMLSDYSYIVPPDMNAALCFCYIDSTAGMSYHFLCLANFETGEIDKKSYDKQLSEKTTLLFRYDAEIEIKFYSGDISIFNERCAMVDKSYHDNEKVLSTRNIKEIDHLRYIENPDDIRILFRKDGLQMEQVWVRLLRIENGNLVGVLLNEPNSDFGVHINDHVYVQLITRGNEIYAICLY